MLLGAAATASAVAQPPPDAVGNPTEISLPSLRAARDRLAEVRDFDSALTPALAAVASQQQDRDEEYASDLTALARIQAELRDTEAAEARYLEAALLIADAEGELSPTLIDVYRGLGRAYIRGERYVEAITALDRARELSRRHLGLFNLEQSVLLDDLTTAHLGLGDTTEAHRLQVERLDNAIRRFGETDLAVVPFRYALADYYLRSRLTAGAQLQYEAALAAQEATLGSTSEALLTPLRELTKLDLLVAQGAESANRDRLLALLEQLPDASAAERGLSLAVLGDWAIVTGDPLAARDYYARAWASLAASAAIDVADYFALPRMLDFVAPLSAVDRGLRRRAYAWGEVVVEFAVGADGRPSGVRVANGEPGTLQELYRQRIRETHFRPRLVAGEPAATAGVRSKHHFRYYVDRDD